MQFESYNDTSPFNSKTQGFTWIHLCTDGPALRRPIEVVQIRHFVLNGFMILVSTVLSCLYL